MEWVAFPFSSASWTQKLPEEGAAATAATARSFSPVWLCDPMDWSPPGSSVHELLQARILEWVAISFSRGSSLSRDQTWILYHWSSLPLYRFFTTEREVALRKDCCEVFMRMDVPLPQRRRKEGVPSLPDFLWQLLLVEFTRETAAKAEKWFAEFWTQYHKAEGRRVEIDPETIANYERSIHGSQCIIYTWIPDSEKLLISNWGICIYACVCGV